MRPEYKNWTINKLYKKILLGMCVLTAFELPQASSRDSSISMGSCQIIIFEKFEILRLQNMQDKIDFAVR